jgi:hypothetical protein
VRLQVRSGKPHNCDKPAASAWARLSVAKVLGVVTDSELQPEITTKVNKLHVSFFNDMDSPFIIVEDVRMDGWLLHFVLHACSSRRKRNILATSCLSI